MASWLPTLSRRGEKTNGDCCGRKPPYCGGFKPALPSPRMRRSAAAGLFRCRTSHHYFFADRFDVVLRLCLNRALYCRRLLRELEAILNHRLILGALTNLIIRQSKM